MPTRRRRLALRLYLASLLQFAVVSALLWAFPDPRRTRVFRLADRETHMLATLIGDEPDEARVARIVDTARRTLGGRVQLLTAAPTRALEFPATLVAIPAHEGHPARWLSVTVPLPTNLLFLKLASMALVVGALVSLGLARTIVGPIEALHRTARRLGQGELQARTDVVRTDELGELAQALDWMAERLERLVRAQGELLGAVSHEVRTPLARMRVALDLSAEGLAPDVETVRDLASDVADLECLVDEMLALSRLALAREVKARHLDVQRSSTLSPYVLADEVTQRFARRFPDRSLVLSASPEACSARLPTSAPLLRRALGNLVHNALVHAPGSRELRVKLYLEDEMYVLSVLDDGPGMDSTALALALQPFARAEDAHTQVPDGLGLGLTVVHRIVEALGGSFTLRSEPGLGTTAELHLPLQTQNA